MCIFREERVGLSGHLKISKVCVIFSQLGLQFGCTGQFFL